ncbi:hypothetical protein RHGRI_016061 [Rhododendron griersonianum]|uniref:NmrA-like domain-containing protein n=1 Tax=Rhododendron griersonianum TaxID=479676 RepID=A0AAV6JTE4_9ERIC|nr:hypothetical protein RHGRI_016061 [Rhododendron griersonianum]
MFILEANAWVQWLNVRRLEFDEINGCFLHFIAVDDPRTLNKILYIKPPKNIYSFDEIFRKIGKTLERIYVPEDQILKRIQESPAGFNYSVFILAINHSVFVKGDQTNFEIEPSFGVEASELYPDVKYTTVEEYLDHPVGKLESPGINHLASLLLAIYHSVFVKGDQTNFEIEPSFGVEASELYLDVKYITVEEYLDQFV